ncbi:MAG: DEAD/DEAH box helicase [Nitrospiraceae bacterium]|jgi:DEAD/DEAH box helicase domain-containing protein|nr:MAG: DEAD/DEAH box helicase [Nitrospiraceae bacterium]
MADDFIGFLKNDREFQLQKAGEKSIPPLPGHYNDFPVKDRLRKVLSDRGITQFYSHQSRAVELIRQGENVLLMTPTASGKSLVYNIPVLESILDDPDAKALYIFPLKGLEQDQLKTLKELSSALGIDNAGEVYDGDTIAAQRRQIRECLPNVIFTNPDMLHLALIPFHKKWEDFFRRLNYIVVDEIHSYRGVFGSHVAQVFRRLKRICAFYGSTPQFISASATIANPAKHAEALTGIPFAVIDESGAPSAEKHFFFLDPVESPYTLTTKLFVNCIENGLRTIVFTKSRKITELIYNWSLNYAPALKERISPYRAGFLPGERRKIEDRLFSGDLLGVISTSALELGVDIGGLDCCILCGYPGSVSSTWQRAGRVGRKGEESFVFLVAIQDALDHYFMRHPGAFFEKNHEAAVIDPANRNILKKHLVCAAAELPLRADDTAYGLEKLSPVIQELASEKALLKAKRGDAWISPVRSPQKDVGIRAIGERFMLLNTSGRLIGEMSGGRIFREAFPGAIYLHRGKQFRVDELDLIRKKAIFSEVKANYYTQPLSTGTTEVIEEKEKRRCKDIPLHWGMLRITEKVVSYDKKRSYDNVRISNHLLDLPEHIFETEGLWFMINEAQKKEISSRRFDLGGIIHAVEHAVIACMPLFSLCDRGDVGGLSHTCFPLFGQPAIFIYDGHEGGVGLSRRAYDIFEDLLETTLKVLDECPCTDGCPSCVQDPQCGNRNEPLDKQGARFLIRNWLKTER